MIIRRAMNCVTNPFGAYHADGKTVYAPPSNHCKAYIPDTNARPGETVVLTSFFTMNGAQQYVVRPQIPDTTSNILLAYGTGTSSAPTGGGYFAFNQTDLTLVGKQFRIIGAGVKIVSQNKFVKGAIITGYSNVTVYSGAGSWNTYAAIQGKNSSDVELGTTDIEEGVTVALPAVAPRNWVSPPANHWTSGIEYSPVVTIVGCDVTDTFNIIATVILEVDPAVQAGTSCRIMRQPQILPHLWDDAKALMLRCPSVSGAKSFSDIWAWIKRTGHRLEMWLDHNPAALTLAKALVAVFV